MGAIFSNTLTVCISTNMGDDGQLRGGEPLFNIYIYNAFIITSCNKKVLIGY